jgi:DNA repair protein RecO (recombination protein O)
LRHFLHGAEVLIETPGIVCALRQHGEHGTIVRILTPDHGLLAGYVRGGRSRTMRPVLMPANLVVCSFRSRVSGQLPSLTVELSESRGPLMAEPLAAAGIEWVTALAATTLPEGHAYPAISGGLDGVLNAIASAPSARGWAAALVRYEVLILSALGYGGAASTVSDNWDDVLAALDQNARRLIEHIFDEHRIDVMAARARLIDRLQRAVA